MTGAARISFHCQPVLNENILDINKQLLGMEGRNYLRQVTANIVLTNVVCYTHWFLPTKMYVTICFTVYTIKLMTMQILEFMIFKR